MYDIEIENTVREYTGAAPVSVEPLPQSGGSRRYYRVQSADRTFIAAVGNDLRENGDFIRISRLLCSRGIPVPEILHVGGDGMTYLQTDLGRQTLYDVLESGRTGVSGYSESQKEMLRQAVRWLARIQFTCADGLESRWTFDRRTVFFDLNYFKYCYLKPSDCLFDEQALENDFEKLCSDLLSCGPWGFMYRDFQARNIIAGEDSCLYFIDYQGARTGPVQYDLVSFLWQAKAGYSDSLKDELTEIYLQEASSHYGIDSEGFRKSLPLFVLFRTLQVLGAYGFRGMVQGKRHFAESIPFALRNLRKVFSSETMREAYPQLAEIAGALAGEEPELRVEVLSFSYKKGLPSDTSGNGGGYIFDCRAVNNPGRYPEYAPLTGEDAPVREFLEKDGTVYPFLDSVFSLADMQVREYIRRRFTNLQIAFGCTGGRHRSVYCAEKTAIHLRDKFGIKVVLVHREQDRRYEL